MPVHAVRKGNKWCVVGPSGKSEGRCYSSKKKAIAQTQAINLSLIRQGKIKPKHPVAKKTLAYKRKK